MKPMIKRAALWRFFLMPSLLCAGLLWTSAVAYAAPSQAHLSHQAHYVAGQNCPYGDAEMDQPLINELPGVVCFTYKNALPPANASVVNSGNYTMTFDWIDCTGHEHFHLVLPPGTLLMQGHGLNNQWAGCPTMSPTNITLSGSGVATTYHKGATCPYGMAEMDDIVDDVGCFISGNAPDCYNITVLNTGLHAVNWWWQDPGLPVGGIHTSSEPQRTIVTMSTANGGFPYMKSTWNMVVN